MSSECGLGGIIGDWKKERKSYKRKERGATVGCFRAHEGRTGHAHDKEGGWSGEHRDERGRKALVRKKKKSLRLLLYLG